MKTWVIDRFEGEYAVCEGEDGKMKDFAKVWLPSYAKEGDVLQEHDDGSFTVDLRETKARRERTRALFDSLVEK